MSVTDCMCIKNGMQLVNREFVYTAKYRIKTDDRSMTGYQVLSGATLVGPHPFPSYYATFVLFGDSDANAFMKLPTIDQDEENGSVWIATATWSPIKGEEESDEHTSREDPLLRPVIYSREWEEIQIPVEQGWNKEELPGIERDAETLGPIENAAGQEPSTPIMKSKRIPVMIAEKNYATLAEIDAIEQTYGDTLNNATYATYAKGECCFRGINASKPKYEGGKRYYTGAIRIACQRGGWDYEMVNRGFKYLDGGELKEAQVLDPTTNEKVPVAEPINLELDGSETPAGQTGKIINYRHRPYTNFGALGV